MVKFTTGGPLMSALLSICGILLFISEKSVLSIAILLVVIAYLIYLCVEKNIPFIWIFLPVIIFGLAFAQRLHFENLKVPTSVMLELRPDQINVEDDFLYGTGKMQCQSVSVSLVPDNQLKKKLKHGRPVVLKILKSDVELVKQATNIAEFDLRSFYATKGIKYQVKVLRYEIRSRRVKISDVFVLARSKLKFLIASLPENLRFFAGELFLGENMETDGRNLVSEFRKLGIIHILSMSGLHVILYTQFIIFISNICHFSPRGRNLFILFFLLVVCFIGNFQPGLLRATMAYLFGIINKKFGMHVNSADQLGIVALIHQLFVPQLFTNIGAQLSYLMVFGLIIMPSKNELQQSVFINCLITPVLLYNFYEFNLLTIIYNFFAIPLFNFCIIPITVSVVLFSKMFAPLVVIGETILKFVTGGLDLFGNQALGMITLGKLREPIVIMTTLALICWFIFWRRKKLAQVYRRIVIIFLLFNILMIRFPLVGQITFIDVGQGDSILFTSPLSRKVMMIDTGGRLNFSGKKSKGTNFEKTTLPYLKSLGITKIDFLFLTHQDADHIGDLGSLLQNIKVKNVVFAKGLERNKSFRRRIEPFSKSSRYIPVLAGQKLSLANFQVVVLYPEKPGDGRNEDSLSLKVRVANRTWIFTGDLGVAGERELVQKNNVRADFIKLGHHGSRTSTSQEFLAATKPQIAFISAGRNNRYGHPHHETMVKLTEHNIKSINTAEYGMINWYFMPFNNYWLETFCK